MNIDEILRYNLIIEDKFFEPNILNIFSSVSLIIIIIISYFFINNSNNKVFSIILLIFMVYIILVVINNNLITNINFSNKYVNSDKIYNDLNTGDIILFRNYLFNNFGFPLDVVTLTSILNTYFTHIGMIYKDPQGKLFIIESNSDYKYCNLSKKIKDGFQLINFNDRIKTNTDHRIHIVKNNIHKYINQNKLHESINKYKDYSFLENGVHCLNLIIRILEENNIIKSSGFIPYIFEDIINSKNYKLPIVFEEPIMVKDY
jgi:hypothetical protein